MPRSISGGVGGQSLLFAVPYPAAANSPGPTISIANYMQTGLQSRAGPSTSPYSGAWVELNNDSDSALLCTFDTNPQPLSIAPGQARSMPVPMGATQISTIILYQNPYQVHPAESIMVNFFTPVDIASGHVPLQGTINPSTPAAAVGPGPLPVGVSIGSGPESMTAQFIGLKNTTPESGVFDALGGRATVLKALASVFLGVNNYFDGTVDRYISSNPAYQLNFSRTAGWQFRRSTDVTPTAGNAITWSAFIPLVDTSGNRYADAAFVQAGTFPVGVIEPATQIGAGALPAGVTIGAAQLTAGTLPEGVTIGADDVGAAGPNETFGAAAFLNPGQINSGALPAGVTLPGSQVTGDLAANQVGPGNLDTDVNLTGQIVSLGGQASVGAFGAAVIVAQVLHTNITVTTLQTLLTYAVPANGLYRVQGMMFLNSGGSGKPGLFCSVQGIDDSAAFNFSLTTSTATQLNGMTPITAGISQPLMAASFSAKGGTNMVITFQDNAGTPNDFVTVIIERLA